MQPQQPTGLPMAHLLTFGTYGAWLPGDPRGWHRRGLSTSLPPSRVLHARCVGRLAHPAVAFDAAQIDVVHRAIVATCAHRGWPVHALVVERTHVHLVVSAPRAPEAIVQYLKAWATRALRERGDLPDQPIWAEHGSTRYLNSARSVEGAVRYVCDPHHTVSGALER